ncbi:hypothetical protein [Methylacidimicrobium sp. B4]|uniref:hypothetical protein n=1 Tax=Methylacidimicrobium sp. B4 TaxID=2796139 RepID=UPI001A907B1F|nr:hypothetical protein [Methylacidimicrobium sp. B4]QSR84726.1 hypothetical protein MacB4_00070 [Methylacidimicrobium sp. B4]
MRNRPRGFVPCRVRRFFPAPQIVSAAALILLVFYGDLSMQRSVASAAELTGIAVAQEGPLQRADARELFSWIEDLLRIQPATVARLEASVGASFHRIERNDWVAVYETSGATRPWVRRVELRLPERANQGWSSFLILDLDPALVGILPSDALGYRPGGRVGLNPRIPPGWRAIGKYWELAAPDFLFWESTDETILLRFRSEGPRRLQQCSLYRKTPISPAAGSADARRPGKPIRARADTGLGSGIDALLDESPDAAAQVQALQGAGWRLSWSPWTISAVDFVQRAILLPKDKNPRKSYSWLLWEVGQIPRPLDSIVATRPAE